MSTTQPLVAPSVPLECEVGEGHSWSPEIVEDGSVYRPVSGEAHPPGRFVRICPSCLIVQTRGYRVDGSTEFTWYSYDATFGPTATAIV